MNCPICNHKIDAHSDPYGSAKPKPGDVTVCLYCANVFVFTEALYLRDPAPEEWEEINRDKRVVSWNHKMSQTTGYGPFTQCDHLWFNAGPVALLTKIEAETSQVIEIPCDCGFSIPIRPQGGGTPNRLYTFSPGSRLCRDLSAYGTRRILGDK